jgi:peptide chain release factor subunit 1
VPADFNINVVRDQISQEISTAANIKSKTTRKNVLAALDKALTELRYYKVTPPKGLVVFAGNISEREGQMDLQSWSFEPPEKLAIRMYRCDQEFILSPLRDMVSAKYAYGLLIMDDKEAVIGTLKGKSISILKELTSMVPGKFRAGGQSAPRFQRVRQEIIKDWYNKLGKLCIDLFGSIENLKGILVGGGGPSKESFIEGPFLKHLKDKVISIQDIGHTGEVALNELVEKSEKILEAEEVMGEKKLVFEFLNHLGKDDGLAVYGKADVLKVLEMGAVDILLISEELDEGDIESFREKAKDYGTLVELISDETKEGQQLLQLGGFGAILRYKVKL